MSFAALALGATLTMADGTFQKRAAQDVREVGEAAQ
jgi:hypothetical protein